MKGALIDKTGKTSAGHGIERIFLVLDSGVYREATMKEMTNNILPPSASRIYKLKKDGSWEMFFNDPLGR